MDTFEVGTKVKMLPHVSLYETYSDAIGTIRRVLDDGRVYVDWSISEHSITSLFHKTTDLEIA